VVLGALEEVRVALGLVEVYLVVLDVAVEVVEATVLGALEVTSVPVEVELVGTDVLRVDSGIDVELISVVGSLLEVDEEWDKNDFLLVAG
jgi:hypothetical protein